MPGHPPWRKSQFDNLLLTGWISSLHLYCLDDHGKWTLKPIHLLDKCRAYCTIDCLYNMKELAEEDVNSGGLILIHSRSYDPMQSSCFYNSLDSENFNLQWSWCILPSLWLHSCPVLIPAYTLDGQCWDTFASLCRQRRWYCFHDAIQEVDWCFCTADNVVDDFRRSRDIDTDESWQLSGWGVGPKCKRCDFYWMTWSYNMKDWVRINCHTKFRILFCLENTLCKELTLNTLFSTVFWEISS